MSFAGEDLDALDYEVLELVTGDEACWETPMALPRLDRGPAYVFGLAELWTDSIDRTRPR